MSDNHQNPVDNISDDERNADSLADMWSAVSLVLLCWAMAIYWVSGQ